MKQLTNLDLNKNELRNAVLHKAETAILSPIEGQLYYNTLDKGIYFYDGSNWKRVAIFPTSTAVDAGKVLSIDNTGNLVWAYPEGINIGELGSL